MKNLNAYIFSTNFIALISKELNGTLIRRFGDGTFYLDKDCFHQFTYEREKAPHVFQIVCTIVRAVTQQDELDIVGDDLIVVDTVVWEEDEFSYVYYDR